MIAQTRKHAAVGGKNLLDFSSVRQIHAWLLEKMIHQSHRGEGGVSEYCGWVFVDNIPLIYEKRRVAKQLKIETWLYLTGLLKELDVQSSVSSFNEKSQSSYIV